MSVDWESVRLFIAHQCAYLFAQPTLTFAALRATKVGCTAFFDTSDCYRPPGLCVCLGELA
jgi:hypothetical protein